MIERLPYVAKWTFICEIDEMEVFLRNGVTKYNLIYYLEK